MDGWMDGCACATSAAVRVRLKGTVALLPVATAYKTRGDTPLPPPPSRPPGSNASAGRAGGLATGARHNNLPGYKEPPTRRVRPLFFLSLSLISPVIVEVK